jgi:23S rRNA (cytidine1920-2'-O)/16S rRNA (cytidine1409-2'-O)-methyltransferase
MAKRDSTESSARKRADVLLVERGLFESRARAQAAIEAGLVTANGKAVTKVSDMISIDATMDARPAHPYVSRGGVKLAAALERYPIDVENHVCLDVGRDQLHPSLRGHPRVVSMEQTDIRSYDGKRLPQRPDVVVIDASFISLKSILPVALSLAAAPMHLLALIKPQFEAPRAAIKKGIVRDAAVHQAVCDDIAAFAATLGCTEIDVFPSPIAGGDGNIEFFLGARRG